MEISIEQTNNAKLLAELNKDVQDLHHELYPKEFKPFDLNEAENAFQTLLLNSNNHAFIAKYQGNVVGYLLAFISIRNESAFQHQKTFLIIDQIAVLKQHRKKGIARKLLEQALLLAKENGIEEIELEYWENNSIARDFFSKNGFKPLKHKMKLKN